MSETKSTPSLESTLKSLDTEEFIDIHFYRPIGYQWALFFLINWGYRPTVSRSPASYRHSGRYLFYFQSLAINVIGIVTVNLGNSYDSADGQLARGMTGQKSALGRILDGAAGDFGLSLSTRIRLRLTPEWVKWIWLLAATTGFFHSKQAAMADYYRNIHLLFLKGKSGSELSHSPLLKENYKKMSWKHDFIYKLFETFYINYTVGQEAWTPKFQHMMNIIREKYNGQAPEWFRKAFRTKSLPLMKYTNMLSFNTRVIALFVSLFIDMPWLYFVFELTVLNSMLLYMIKKHEHICEDFSKQL